MNKCAWRIAGVLAGLLLVSAVVLVVTNMYPTPDSPAFGVFVEDQVQALRQAVA